MRRRLLLAVLLAVSGEASAHGSIQGIDHFSGGLLHPLVEPTHLISLVALGLLVGQRGIAKAEAALFCFATGVAAGLICAAFGRSIDADVPLLVIATLSGLWVAMSLALPEVVYGGIAGLLGAGIGMGSNPEAFTGTALVAALGGAGIGAIVWLFGIAAIVNLLKKPWLSILVRVIGSWVSASSILVLALWISGKHVSAPGAESPSAAVAHMDTTR